MQLWMKSISKSVLPYVSKAMFAFALLLTVELIYRITVRLLRKAYRRHPEHAVESAIRRLSAPIHCLLLALTAIIAINAALLPPALTALLLQIFRPMIIGIAGWLIGNVVLIVFDGLQRRYAWKGKRDNLLARRVSTQLKVFRNTSLFITIVLTLFAMAMTLPGLRILGISLFASAGVAGLVIGMAARPALSNLIAGIQLALTQPIRLDDVVIIEGEWGRIEEITASYVVVLVWDERRLIVPLSYFIEHPFQNWTHTSSEMLGTVFLYLDYTVPLDVLRAELERIVKPSPLWDQRVCLIQVTDSKDRTVEVRALISSHDASSLWDLRCEVREKLLVFLQQNYPTCLPRLRAEIQEKAA